MRDAVRVHWQVPYFSYQHWPHAAIEFDNIVEALADMTMDDQIALIGMPYPDQLVHIKKTTTMPRTL